MSEQIGKGGPDADTLFALEKQVPELGAATRARAIARARASLEREPAMVLPRPGVPVRSSFRFALAAGIAGVSFLAAGAFAALYFSGTVALGGKGDARPATGKMFRQPAVEPRAEVEAPREAIAEPPLPPPVAAKPVGLTRSPPSVHARVSRDELLLLQQARRAINLGDYGAALPPLEEHGRHFPDGRLAEEREALRVRTLVGLGRSVEASKVATAFAARFPRSPLLPAVKRLSTRTP